MDFLNIAMVFILGTIIGSFLNVVIYRYNSGTSPLTGRSQCLSCGKTLSWRQLVPIFSFLVSRGRCAKCGVRLSWQYPIVEAISGAIFVAVFLLGKPISETVILLAIFSTLLAIAVYDLRHQIIPDGLAVLFAVLGLVKFFLAVDISRAFHFPYYWTLIAGPMLFFPFWALWFVSRGRWIGLGDGKLALGIGWFLGATLGGSAVMLAFWVGAVYALAIMGLQRASQKLKKVAPAFLSNTQLSMQSEIPFGPFLILAVFIVYFTGVNFFDGSFMFLNFL
ncbi:MAG: Type 4 prepilin-like protein leader peptide-processing enzyme [Candidatus Curtissbacteria bacterium GW2011_GWA1_40_47]|uniref:Type 4 prepilin-like protein leader peptide-processing enzyme n=1 Tax=Candidatus Nomurabacteria bacterium GW2011_GWC2_42_20 TaxID=1618756 RepID=A0A0G0ZHU4_9BACT|nr:MAG: Type 4 prepilin-like protein leader peptide-processing enzyme [Candidatus Curtissbacteria bacterium GW2011_GWA1_40_47]KKS27076.1 MAG: Type 4 prepilin-like protein leader peptide-processing enzyme [Parcubacteria group bacterium GW2011_GWC1_42_11]KKS48317.1 MAG: Type 4 prepilin-like protein leader peptide-processing enzyme [Candidatus Nomurabacteria bacterium GW2011_GWC2_42_20]KKS58381.1 MAG: Type 4 prepilin-like protein leader peptide-processing enzyme [Candidatus Nomurabacteria bacterium